MMTPIHINLILHHHCHCEPYSKNNQDHANSQAVNKFRQDLLDNGILVEDSESGSGYMTTEKGVALVRMLESTPYPKSKWVNPLTGKVIHESN